MRVYETVVVQIKMRALYRHKYPWIVEELFDLPTIKSLVSLWIVTRHL